MTVVHFPSKDRRRHRNYRSSCCKCHSV